jgi:hypothetical protein
LRRQDDGIYTFIGDCYIYAKMKGEMTESLIQAIENGKGPERFILA